MENETHKFEVTKCWNWGGHYYSIQPPMNSSHDNRCVFAHSLSHSLPKDPAREFISKPNPCPFLIEGKAGIQKDYWVIFPWSHRWNDEMEFQPRSFET